MLNKADACVDSSITVGDAFLRAPEYSLKSMENQRLHILHVDDDAGFLQLTQEILELSSSFEVCGMLSVEEALGKIANEEFDVIVCDYQMPERDGLEFLQQLRAQGNTTPFIIFTGKGREDVVVKALNMGAFRYINKHGDPEVVYKELSISITQACDYTKARAELLRSEEQFRQLFSNMPSGVAVYEAVDDGKDFVLVDFNKSAEKIEKSFKEYVIGRRVTETFPGVKEFGLFQVLQRVWQTGKSEYFPAAIYRDNRDAGTWRENWVYKLPNGNVVAIYNDITERKQSEAVLKKSEERYREFADSLPEVVFELDPNGKMTYVNKKGFELTGYTAKDFAEGICVFDLLLPSDVDRAKGDTASVLSGSGLPRSEFMVKRKDGSRFPVAIESVPVVSDGEVTGLRGIAIDLTENHKKEMEIRSRTREVNRIIDGIGDLLFVLDSDRRIVRVNKSTCDAFKKTPEAFLGKHCYEVVHGTDKPWSNCPATKTFESKVTCSEEILDPQVGVPLLVTTSPIVDENGKLVQCVHIAKDITEQKNKEAQLRAITNSAIDSIILVDNEGNIVFWSPAAERTFGYTSTEILGKNLHLILSPKRFHADYEEGFALFKKTGQGNAIGQTLELTGLRKDGAEFPIEISLSALQLDGKWHALGLVRDITERKKAEKELRENRDQVKIINEKLRVIGSLTRHDVLNKLCIVTGNSFLLKSKHKDQVDIADKLSRIEQAVRDTQKIFDFAKIYEQLGVEKPSLIGVSKAIDEAVALVPDSLDLKIVNECHGLRLLADSFLSQIFYNLVDNSIKHGGHVTGIRIYFEMDGEGQLKVIYEDNGLGITEANKAKLFKEGFSTGGSSGYGLHLIKKMIEVYGWDIQETGEHGKGAKFTISIPMLNANGEKNFKFT